jgi:4-hydroxybenzoate polyprenyltransferase
MLPAWIDILRIPHWVKNGIIFAMVVFLDRVHDADAWGAAGVAFGAFCLAASAVYALNDVFDRESDAAHAERCVRPLPSGRMSTRAALLEALLLTAGALGLALLARLPGVVVWICAYILLNIAYDWRLKRIVVVDAVCISLGFVFRLLAASSALHMSAPRWLVTCTFSLCLCVSFGKRLLDNGFIVSGDAESGVAGAAKYTERSLRMLLVLSGAISGTTYLFYTLAPATRDLLGTSALVVTVPFVIAGLVRYARICMRKSYHNLPEVILKDRPLQTTVVLWLLSCGAIVAVG